MSVFDEWLGELGDAKASKLTDVFAWIRQDLPGAREGREVEPADVRPRRDFHRRIWAL